MTDSEKLQILNYALENGEIDFDSIQSQIQAAEREKYLNMHPYKIWQGPDGGYFTYLPDNTRANKRARKKRNKREDLEDLIVSFWKNKEEFVSVEEVFTEWNDRRLKLGQISHATYDRNIVIFNRHFSELRDTNIRNITPQLLNDFFEEEIADKKLSAKSFSNLKGITKGFLRRAQRRGLIDFSVNHAMQDLDLSDSCFWHNDKNDADDIFTEDEFAQLASYLKEHIDIWNLGILLLMSSGLRVGELVALKWEDFLDDSYTQFRVNRTETHYTEIRDKDKTGKEQNELRQSIYEVKESPKTRAGRRIVTLPEECVWLVDELHKINPDGEYLFMRNGKRMKSYSIRDRLYNICDKLGFERKSPHKGRKTYASILLDHGVDNAFIIAQLGHTNISCTENYYHKDRKSNDTKLAIMNSIPEFEVFGKG